ncbi:ankyrin repeat protein [Colletotrichum tofieldiae]|nr:ankyrin repeat protein [Colletotrichum tofieldiae]GKT68323.1 ankyrin repeat protein [Colletotrichum tofieldiae]
MIRIESQLEDQVALAKDALSWIICSVRPLSTEELQEALAVERGTTEIDEDNRPEIEDVVSVCAGLVIIDEESHVVRLVHYTTQEYFERTRHRWLPDADAFMAVSCITYLNYSNFSSGPCGRYEATAQRVQSNPLYDYAARNRGFHANSSPYLCREMIELFENHAKLHASFHLAWAMDQLNKSPSCWYSTKRAQDLSGLHLAAYFGIEKVLDHARGEITSTPETAQSYLTNWKDGLGLLDINIQDDLGRTPLFYAVARGFEVFTKALLEFPSVDADKGDIYNRTPLAYASSLGYTNIVDRLISTGGVDVNLRDKAGRTPLHHAVRCGSDGVVEQLLIASKIEPDVQDINGQTALFFAVRFNRKHILKNLLQTGKVAVDSRDNLGFGPLHLVADRIKDSKQLVMLEYLVEMGGADPTLEDNEGRTALLMAVDRGNADLEMYLRNKANDDERLSVCNNTGQSQPNILGESGPEDRIT